MHALLIILHIFVQRNKKQNFFNSAQVNTKWPPMMRFNNLQNGIIFSRAYMTQPITVDSNLIN